MTDTPATQRARSTPAPDTVPPVLRTQFRVPEWLRRVGLASWFLIGAAIAMAGLIALIAATRDITGPLVIGGFLAIVFLPVVDWLEAHGLKRGGGAAIVLVGLIVVLGGVVVITADALAGQSEVLIANLDEAVDEIKAWADDLPISESAVDEVDRTAREAAPVVRDGVGTALASLVDSAAGLVAGLILGLMVLYYLLKDLPRFASHVVASDRDPATRSATQRIFDSSFRSVQGYFGGKTALALVNGASIAVGVYLMGVPAALAIGVVNFVGAYIPYIGAFLGGAFAVLMALGEGGIELALAAFVLVMAAQLILENLLEPKLLGSSLKLHPLAILLVTTLGGLVAGMIGLILAAPALAIGLDLVRELRQIGFFDDDVSVTVDPTGVPVVAGVEAEPD